MTAFYDEPPLCNNLDFYCVSEKSPADEFGNQFGEGLLQNPPVAASKDLTGAKTR